MPKFGVSLDKTLCRRQIRVNCARRSPSHARLSSYVVCTYRIPKQSLSLHPGPFASPDIHHNKTKVQQRRFHGSDTRRILVRRRSSRERIEYGPGDPAFSLHTVISDKSEFAEHVTVENSAGQQFPVPLSLIDQVASPPGPRLLPYRAQVRQNGENRPRMRPQERPRAIRTPTSTPKLSLTTAR